MLRKQSDQDQLLDSIRFVCDTALDEGQIAEEDHAGIIKEATDLVDQRNALLAACEMVIRYDDVVSRPEDRMPEAISAELKFAVSMARGTGGTIPP